MQQISIAKRPLCSIFLPVPIVCFIGALATDSTYQASDGNLLWLSFSTWLLAVGELFGAIALVIILIDAIRGHGWAKFVLLLGAWIVELLNSFIHARDGWTAVVPTGMVLSIVGVVLVLLSGWMSQSVRCIPKAMGT